MNNLLHLPPTSNKPLIRSRHINQYLMKKSMPAFTPNIGHLSAFFLKAEQREQLVQMLDELIQWEIQSLINNISYVRPPQPMNNYESFQLVWQFLHQIRLPYLQHVSLKRGGIVSIEGLCRMYIPNLKQMHLEENHINCINTFIKIRLPLVLVQYMIYQFSLEDNPINQFSALIYTGCTDLSEISFGEIIREPPINKYMNDFRWIVKCKNKFDQMTNYQYDYEPLGIKLPATVLKISEKYNRKPLKY